MGILGTAIKSEMIRLAGREMRKAFFPLRRDVRLLKGMIPEIRRAVLTLQRFVAQQEKDLGKRKIPLKASPEEVKKSRFSPRLLRSLRKHLGITQKELAVLTGVTVGAAHQWEIGKFRPKDDKKAVLAGLRKLNRREVRKLLEERG
jgi:DNA-binding transcriptional regulator YiaG